MQTTAKPFVVKLGISLLFGVAALTLTACGGTKWGFPYRADIQQGNWITSEQVDRLEIGMTREQVRFILGTPTLQDVFRANRWDYPYYNKPGYGKVEERKFTVWFEDDLLVRWEGDKQPDRQPFQPADASEPGISPTKTGTPEGLLHTESEQTELELEAFTPENPEADTGLAAPEPQPLR